MRAPQQAPFSIRLAQTLRRLERLLLPNACVHCERMVEASDPDALVCFVCHSRLRVLEPGCGRCRQPLPPIGPCRFCADWPERLRRVESAIWLGDEARSIVHHLKYEGYSALAAWSARIIETRLARPEGCLVPIPLAAGRRRERGYNQSLLIARRLAQAWDLPVRETVLRRVRDTRSQTTLSPDRRRRNVAGAFAAEPPAGGLDHPAAATAVLIDDVLTTGATVAAAAGTLAAAGWTAVTAVTFARARPFVVRAASA
jgi:ComF family protein